MQIKEYLSTKKGRIETLVLPLLAFIFNMIAYSGARLIAGGRYHHDITSSVDTLIPLVPWTITVYFGCYIFWVLSWFIAAMQNENRRYRFFAADTFAKAISMAVFIAYPTTNIRPEIVGDGIWSELMRFLYSVDSADNLLPSLHCMTSWLCFIGVRRRKDISLTFKCFACVLAFAVFISTLTTKQHVIVDVFAGALLAELCYLTAGLKPIRETYGKFISCIVRLFAK